MKKILLILLLVIVVVLLFASGILYFILKQSVPDHSGTVNTPIITNSVEITFDEMGIPQIWARNEQDAFFAMGYLQASDRLFQMDLTRRVAQGRLAELLGPTVFELDVQQRTIGHYKIADFYLDKLSEGNRRKLQAFSDGINTYKKECAALPFEYQLMRTDFEDWTIHDCLSILSFQTWFSDALMSPDAFFVKASEKVGIDKARGLNVSYPDWAPVIVPENQHSNNLVSAVQTSIADKLFASGTLPFLMSNSSNSWVISPERSESGAAMLSSDPHLEVTRLPQFWYYLGVHIGEKDLHAIGITTPGLPMIIMGHNTKIAWAFTVSGVDVSEYFIEKINPDDSTQYRTPSGWEPFAIRKEKIFISGSDEPKIIEVRSSNHGPIVFSDDSLSQVYTLHWAGFDADINDAVSAAFSLIEMEDFKGFQKAVTNLGALDASWTYADADGNIGYQLGTPIPVRPNSGKNFPVPGWTDEFEWDGFYPLDQTPSAYNPVKGWIATCNNKADQANLDYNLEGFFAADRILSIDSLLNSKEKFSVSDMQQYQMDIRDHYLMRWRDIIKPLLIQHNFTKWAIRLAAWVGQTNVNSVETAFINLFLYNLRHTIFHDELGKNSARISTQTLEVVFQSNHCDWFDNIKTQEKNETKSDVFITSVNKTIAMLQGKTWGDIHTLTMQHPLSVVPGLSSLLNLSHGPYPWAGTAGTLNASFFMEKDGHPGQFESIVGPSWRFVIDFSDIDAATIVLPAGNSGNPMSPHFMDFFEMWKNGKRWNVPTTYTRVKEKAVKILYLEPKI